MYAVQAELQGKTRATVDESYSPSRCPASWRKARRSARGGQQLPVHPRLRSALDPGAGVGCSKVPDIHNVALMEDRATLRILQPAAGQLVAARGDHRGGREGQPAADGRRGRRAERRATPTLPMARTGGQPIAFQAAQNSSCRKRPATNGYTEPILHHAPPEFKARAAACLCPDPAGPCITTTTKVGMGEHSVPGPDDPPTTMHCVVFGYGASPEAENRPTTSAHPRVADDGIPARPGIRRVVQ